MAQSIMASGQPDPEEQAAKQLALEGQAAQVEKDRAAAEQDLASAAKDRAELGVTFPPDQTAIDPCPGARPMSEDRDDSAAEEFDLTDVPMDDAPAAAAEGEEDGEEKKPEGKPALDSAELERRLANARIALSTERAKRREAERRAEARADRDGDERAPAARVARQEEPEEIDPDVDPVGALKQATAKIRAYEAAQRLDEQTDAQRQARDRQLASVENALSEHETDFREDHPDYDDAAKHYAVARAQELTGFGLAPAQILPMLREEFATLASTAIRAGKKPGGRRLRDGQGPRLRRQGR